MRLPDELDANARVMVRDDGTDVRARRAINLTGTGAATITVEDNPTTEAVDVTIDVTVGEEPITDHGALSGLEDDDHTQYQLRSEKSAADGYASLDTESLVPTGELGTGTASSSTFLRGDQTWDTPGGSHFEDLFGPYYDESLVVDGGDTYSTRVVSVTADATDGPWLSTTYEDYGDRSYSYLQSGLHDYALSEGFSTSDSYWSVEHMWDSDYDQRSVTAYLEAGSSFVSTETYVIPDNWDRASVTIRSGLAGVYAGSYRTADNSSFNALLGVSGGIDQISALLYVDYQTEVLGTSYEYFGVFPDGIDYADGGPHVEQCVSVSEPEFRAVPADNAGLLTIWLDETNDELNFKVVYSDNTTVKSGTVALA